ncbi:ficolin-2-like [Dreissena polymorpha]|uniref:ficolin-2-like n=1 Tax=Dreissena polymorpha TaxID=45954 RepID=UPI002264A88C|nr:ficolin-2-like [Dreissena polymorpha]
MRKQHDDFDSRFKSAERKLRSDINKNKNEAKADITATQTLLHTIQNDTRAYCDDRLILLNESFENRSLKTLQEISRITSVITNLKTSNEISKNVSDDISRRQSKYHNSCDGVAVSGEYIINPYGMKVYCDVDSKNKGWIVIQRRMDGSVDFNRSWADYKAGFGNVKGEFWLGNEYIYQLTKDQPKELRIDMETFDGRKRYALYSAFSVLSESEKYKLRVAGNTGDARDNLETVHNNVSFSTFDADNDQSTTGCCACKYGGGWWYDQCFLVNLNGKYFKESETASDWQGIRWYSFTSITQSLKYVQMSIH